MGKVVDLTGYKYAKKASEQSQEKNDALMHIMGSLLQRPGTMTTTLNWVSVSDWTPGGFTSSWYAVLLECVGGLKIIASSQFANGEWLQVHKDGFTIVTHWAELPVEMP